MRLRHLDLFSGIGGFSLGLEATGSFKTVAFCDIEKYCLEILEKRFPGVPRYTDIKELTYDRLKADGIISKNKKIDILTCGYPCQPFSVAGRKKGEEEPRHLWPECFRLIKECRPTWVIGENVGGHIKLGLDTVLENLESEGYAVRTFSIPASAIGANHKRERVWIVANTDSGGHKGEKSRSIGKENEEEKRDREINSSTRVPNGADTILTQQGSETEVEYVENTRRSLRQGTFIRGENEKETGQGNADLTQRSGEASQSDVADTESKRTRKNDERVWERSSRARGRETTTVADTVSGNAQAGCERRREIREGHQGEGISSNASGGGEDMADTKSSSRNVNEINKEYGETETQEIFGDGSSLSRTQEQVVVDTVSERGRGGETWGQDAENAWQPSTSPWDGWWDIEPDVGRVAHGVSARTPRLKGLGNSLVPAIPFHIGNVILEVMKDD